MSKYRVVLSDIGGVLGTNGWDNSLRHRLYQHFEIDADEVEPRHRLMFDSYERGFVNFESYIRQILFYKPQPFTFEEIREFVYSGSVPWRENINYLRSLRKSNGLKLGLISNEGEGITGHRIRTFGLAELADFIVVSHFVHMRKPDPAIWRLGLDLAAVQPHEAIYIDDRKLFAEIATELGLKGIQYQNLEQLDRDLAGLGLKTGGEPVTAPAG